MKKFKFFLVTFLFSVSILAFQANAQKEGLNVGDKIPEIEAKSIDGKTIKLSSLKGKIVLVDFWASWCPPCRAENPKIVSAYNEFKNAKFKNGKGFTVYSFSLDKKAASWKAAIKKDKLAWEYHVSELKGWYSPTSNRFGINSIPSSFLIDGNGIILAKDLRGEQLDQFLKSIEK